MMRIFATITILALIMMVSVAASAGENQLAIEGFGKARSISASALLARNDLATIEISNDPAYMRTMTYAAVPFLALLPDTDLAAFDTLEIRATDGFVSQLPTTLFESARSGGATPWLAIEMPNSPWPKLPGKNISAGPFFLVWQHPARSRIGPEQWPYAIASIEAVASPIKRWPNMSVADDVPENAPERHGLVSFIKNCLACHKIDGAGKADVGPDLARPVAPTEYMTRKGLKQLIRDPASVRTWPDQKMQGFPADILPDDELDDLIAYISHIARRREMREVAHTISDKEIVVVRPTSAQSSKQRLRVFEGISGKTAGAEGISMIRVVIPPGGQAEAHYHKGYETAIYVLQGRVETRYGQQLKKSVVNQAGDFIFIPPDVPHQPRNLSSTEPAIAIVTRTDPNEQESVVTYQPK